jgi:hypothetical protein
VKAPTPIDPPVETPPPAVVPPAAPPTEATWPRWVRPVDGAMAVLVLITAFLVASTIARNSDQWLHYASGRALATGAAGFGVDPFSHVGETRVWVNHSWLAGLGMYALHQADATGFVLVAVKAFLFAAAFGLLFLIRRPDQSLWPWVLAAAIAVIAAAPQTFLRPFVLTAPFLALTLLLLLGRDWKTTGRTNTIALGILFWLWASCDAWFVLGPLAVALVLLGEVVQRGLRPEPDDRMPSIPQLAAALAVGVLAASATPHHVRVWQVPVELGLGLPANFQADPETAMISLSPLNDRLFLRLTGRGWNGNGLAFAGLLVGGGLVLALGFARLRVAHLLLWIAFAGLALVHFRLVLPFAIVAVPVFARALGGLVDRLALGAPDAPRAKLLVLLSSVGRIIAFPFALILVAAAYPGWLHPPTGHPAYAPRVAWGIEPDPGLKRTAELLQGWRDAGTLPPAYRGIVMNFDLANHIAWFAPKEKVLVNARYAHHLPELERFITARRIFLERQVSEPIDDVEISNFRQFCQEYDITYVVYGGLMYSTPQRVDTAPLYQLSSYSGNYSLWHADGRAIVLGDRDSKHYTRDGFRALAFDPVRLAFRPDLARPVGSPPNGERQVPRESTFLDPFVIDPPKPPPLESLDAVVWNEIAVKTAEEDYFRRTVLWPQFGAAVGNLAVSAVAQEQTYRADDLTIAYRVLALRAAFRAIAENPKHPDAYFIIAYAGGFGRGPEGKGVPSGLPGLRDDLKQQFEIAGLCQYLERISPPDRIAPGAAAQAFFASQWLFQHYAAADPNDRRPPMTESMSQVFALARAYYARSELAARDPKRTEQVLKAFDDQANKIDAVTARANDRFQQVKKLETHQQVRAAIELRLYAQAQALFEEAWPEALGPDPVGLTLQMVRVYAGLGKLEDADYFLRECESILEKPADNPQIRPQHEAYARFAQDLRAQLWQLRGDFPRAGEAMEQSVLKLKMSDIERGFVRVAAAKPTLRQFDGFLNVPHLMAAVGGLGTIGQGEIQFSLDKWQTYVDFFIHRGLVLLLEGKPAEARYRFEQALRPEKIDLPGYLPQRAIAEQYIRLIDNAAK